MAVKKNNAIGEKLRHCRTNCGFSQQQVADALGVERTTYTCYENGRFEPSLNTISMLSQIFRVDVSELLPGEASAPQLKDPSDKPIVPIYSLTKDEKSLISAFRVLNDKDKSIILDKITNMRNHSN